MYNKKEVKEAIDKLRSWAVFTDTREKENYKNIKVWARVNHVTKSGMNRDISFYILTKDDGIKNINDQMFTLLNGYKCSFEKYNKIYYAGVRVGGCGMDMIFNSLYNANYEVMAVDGVKVDRGAYYYLFETNYNSL